MYKYFDYYILFAILTLVVFGLQFVFTASFSVETQMGLEKYSIMRKHINFVILSGSIFFIFSILRIDIICKMSFIMCAFLIAMLLLIPIVGIEVNGASRWLTIMNYRFQPSEILKPFLLTVSGILMTTRAMNPGAILALALISLVVLLLLMQPDFGQSILVMTSFFIQYYACIKITKIHLILFLIMLSCLVYLYSSFDYFIVRIVEFLSASGNMQLRHALKGFENTSIMGNGISDGNVKYTISHSHNDFIFSVVADEFGIGYCIILVLLFLFITMRSMILTSSSVQERNYIIGVGLISLFFIQASIHFMSSTGMIPTKGMSLPLVGYGGSNMLSSFICLGIVMSIIRSIKYEQKTSSCSLWGNIGTHISSINAYKDARRMWSCPNNYHK